MGGDLGGGRETWVGGRKWGGGRETWLGPVIIPDVCMTGLLLLPLFLFFQATVFYGSMRAEPKHAEALTVRYCVHAPL